jgi:F420-0:gamma-glutamyl ligase-like protein
MSSLKPNRDKKLQIVVDGVSYARYPVRTHIVSSKDSIIDVLKKYTQGEIQKDDALFISERCIAVMQGRSFLIDDIKPGWWANTLCKFVTKHPGGIGLRSPWTMQLALNEAGLLRILFAAIIAALTRPFKKGLFYHLVGNDINAIDGPCDYTLPPGNKSAKLGPKNPKKVAKQITDELHVGVAIIDANDYGVRVMANTTNYLPKQIEAIFKDNPLGQTDEQTPLAIVRVQK